MIRQPVTFRVEAEADFDAAFDWYQAQRPGLGLEFAERVQDLLDGIAARPALYPRIFQDVRRALVRRFPYLVLYQVKAEHILVVAIFHGSRDPGIWRARV